MAVANDAFLAGIHLWRAGSPEKVAEVVGFLASDAASYLNGVALDMGGGQLLAVIAPAATPPRAVLPAPLSLTPKPPAGFIPRPDAHAPAGNPATVPVSTALSTSMAKNGSGGWLESIKTILYAGLIAIGIRTIAFEPFNIPSGSMIPTLLVGDYLFVSKYSYGYSRYSMPFGPNLFSGRILGALPQRGDVAVFRLPRDPSQDYIKRIVGLPGDRIEVRAGVLHVNGAPVRREALGPYTVVGDGPRMTVRLYREALPGGATHQIIEQSDDAPLDNVGEVRVPENHVFAMGDNRDNSLDSRVQSAVGFIPLENLVGRAEFIFFSVDGSAALWEIWAWPFAIRWGRLFSAVR